jgi:hypothetical protein
VITRRSDQIDYNLSRQNNSDIFSGNNWTQETAKQAAKALKDGHPVIVPQGGPIADSIHRLQAQGIDGAFFNDLEARKNTLRSSFGTEGITAQPPEKNELATGIMLNQQHDTSRISGGIGDALERFVKAVFNQHVQFYYVYYDEPHYGMILGQMQAVQYKTLSQEDFVNTEGHPRRLVVSVSPDSLKPHDEMTEYNQAIALWEAGALDPKTLLIRTKFPDPQKTAEQTVLWKIDPQTYMALNFPEMAQKVQQAQVQAQAAMQQAQQQQAEQEAQGAQQQQQIQGAQAQQGMAIKEAQVNQQLTQKEKEHEQKLRHDEELHKAKLKSQEEAAKKLKTKKKEDK